MTTDPGTSVELEEEPPPAPSSPGVVWFQALLGGTRTGHGGTPRGECMPVPASVNTACLTRRAACKDLQSNTGPLIECVRARL
ncbi:hypothetical protein NDU88_003643 [Pleurodeles waltl]|uniref:Uncharacterized protein n=1 Tax=Pleurodeles waltl TaxID=8319 RepID=A0AAV7MU10_PLEWA|nr:hypothetical protein NDU88_003643 [Pleurodeles waltl]